MEATKTKTGKWTCCAYYKDADGKIRRPRFTANRKKDAERMAEACSLEHKDDYKLARRGLFPLSFRMAAVKYIESREPVLSPATVKAYCSMLQNGYDLVNDKNIYEITAQDAQTLVSSWAQNKSPKTVRNLYGLFSAIIKSHRPDFSVRIDFPRSIKPILRTPTDQDIYKLYAAVKGTRMELPIIIAATGGLRRSEICALTINDIGNGSITICKSVVMNRYKKWVTKSSTKTDAGIRTAYVPKEVTDRIREVAPSEGPIVSMNPTMISEAFPRLLKKLGIPKFRFHDLRSYYASVMHLLGVPDVYIMQYGGWHDRQTLQKHYQRTQDDQIPEMAEIGMKHFSQILSNK